ALQPAGKPLSIHSVHTAPAPHFAPNFSTPSPPHDSMRSTPASNNTPWMAQQSACTNNRERILWFAKQNCPESAKVTQQSLNPKGPKGRFHLLNAVSHSIFEFSPQKEEARAFLRWLSQPKQLGGWYASADSYYQPLLKGYHDAPMWDVEPRNKPYRDALDDAHLPGWPAPASRRLAESVAKYVVVDMFAKACAGTSTKDAIKAADAQLK